jgi:predicted acetyltransferase
MATVPILHSATLPDVPPLRDEGLELVLIRRSSADARCSWAPAYHFEMRVPDGEVAGWIDLRVGDSEDILLYNGHIGYTVREQYRGHRYAARACRLLFDVARRHGFSELWITCNPENTASRRTCEIAGGELIEIVDLPSDNELYRRGERQKCRYRIAL